MRKTVYFLLLIMAIAFIGFWAANNNDAQKAQIKVFFAKNGSVLPVARGLSSGQPPEKEALSQLLKGPSGQEIQNGFFTEIPKGTKGSVISNKNGIITVNFSDDLGRYGGGTARVQALLSQIVFTLTETSGISRVKILVSGKEGVALGSEGFAIEKPLSKKDILGD
ncbi:MAG: GerMN domain-containing protein [Candidatus Margulisiibacteriota bacterium]